MLNIVIYSPHGHSLTESQEVFNFKESIDDKSLSIHYYFNKLKCLCFKNNKNNPPRPKKEKPRYYFNLRRDESSSILLSSREVNNFAYTHIYIKL